MKFSEQWLRTMANPPIDSAALAEVLTMAGLEVEAREPAGPPLEGVVVARIVKAAKHPNADKLQVCEVDAGDSARMLTIVCGAPNARAGMTAPLARVGAQLPGGVAIREAKVRGVDSQGMLCSAKELGLDDDASGLLVLDDSLAPGTPLRDALALDDMLLTLKLTPNRSDCLSIAGVAREVAAVTGVQLEVPRASIESTSQAMQRVDIRDTTACPRFASRVVEGVDASAPTPSWMKRRLERSGIRPISAIVDITNYVMLELGQPLHAYDRALLEGDIVVRFAQPGETLLLLNGETLKLEPDLLLVCDERKPLGLAGIMGGEHSGITATTKDVLLEGAYWNPAAIQGRMRRLGFTSDAGYRFERGVDFELAPLAVDRATQLVVDICGGRAGPLSDVRHALPTRQPVKVRAARVRRILGVEVSSDEIGDVFSRLGFRCERQGDEFVVTPPSYRFDLSIEEDFIEEVARIRGYDAIPATIGAHRATMLAQPESSRPRSALRARLVARDWQEVVTFSFVDSAVEAVLDPNAKPVRVLNPIAAQRDVMRTTLLPGLLEVLQTNVNRRANRVRIFEIGRVFHEARASEAVQPLRIGGLAFGPALPEQWGVQPTRPVDFFDVKGDLEALVLPKRLTTSRSSQPWLHPGRAADVAIDGVRAGFIGELHPRLVRHFSLPRAPIVFELDLAAALARERPFVRPLSRQPLVRRDLAIVVDEAVPAQSVLDVLAEAKAPHVDAFQLFDVYRGGGLPNGRKSLAILVLMQDTARTLTDADIDSTLADIVSLLERRFGATLRM